MENYNFFVYYSKEDEGFIGIIPDLPFLSAFGETPEKAVKELMIAKEGWLEAARLTDAKIPEPSYHPLRLFLQLASLSKRIKAVEASLVEVTSNFDTMVDRAHLLLANASTAREAEEYYQGDSLIPAEEEYAFARSWRGKRS